MREKGYEATLARERTGTGPRAAERGLRDLAHVQRQILHQLPPPVPHYRIELAYRPAYFATGDYHDFFDTASGPCLFIGDGSGHGPVASILMVTMRTIMRTHLQMHGDPGPALATACRLFHPLIPSDRFMTGVYARLGADGCFAWASAGHHPPIWMHADGRIERMDRSVIGLPLATVADETYSSVHWNLSVGDRIVLFTDGLVEARNRAGDIFGRERLEGTVRDHRNDTPATFFENLLNQAGDHLAGTEFEDDFTLMAIERVD